METIKYPVNDFSTLQGVLDLSKIIFKPTSEEELLYHDPNDWKQKISQNGLLITAVSGSRVCGFAICYIKEQGSLHIWNVGVSKDYRNKGIWKSMYEMILDFAKKKGIKRLTLNTYPARFPNMYKFVQKNNFMLIGIDIAHNEELGEVEKYRFELLLN